MERRQCTPENRTPHCGEPGCEAPAPAAPETIALTELEQLRLANVSLRVQAAQRELRQLRALGIGMVRLILTNRGVEPEPSQWRLDPTGTRLVWTER
jgi:hypothetical protein